MYSHLVAFGRTRKNLYVIPCEKIRRPTIVVPNQPRLEIEQSDNRPTNRQKQNGRSGRQKRNSGGERDVPIHTLNGGYFVVKPRLHWANLFDEIIRSFPPTT